MASAFHDLRPEQVPNAVTQSFPNVHFLAKLIVDRGYCVQYVRVAAYVVRWKRLPLRRPACSLLSFLKKHTGASSSSKSVRSVYLCNIVVLPK
jgi:hypothetical protein